MQPPETVSCEHGVPFWTAVPRHVPSWQVKLVLHSLSVTSAQDCAWTFTACSIPAANNPTTANRLVRFCMVLFAFLRSRSERQSLKPQFGLSVNREMQAVANPHPGACALW
jgi:hypothetical protein